MTDLPDVDVHMIRPTLDALPDWPLPTGYSLRAYQQGDMQRWVDLHLDAEPFFQVNAEHFMESFGDHLEALPDRMFFVQNRAREDVGSITAWWQDDWRGRGPWGQIHWVVVAKAHQRRGLSKPMTAYALRRIARDHPRAMLDTNTRRAWAIKSYLDCGFLPDPAERTNEEYVQSWRAVQSLLHHPALDHWLAA